MHDKPKPSDHPAAAETALDSAHRPTADLVAEMASVDPAEAPEIADAIAVRLKAQLETATDGSQQAEGPAEGHS